MRFRLSEVEGVLDEREAPSGASRYRVRFRVGGRESAPRYGGMFETKRDAVARRAWIVGELAAMRVPDLAVLGAEPIKAPTLAEVRSVGR